MRFVLGKAEARSDNYLMEIALTSDSPEDKRPVIPSCVEASEPQQATRLYQGWLSRSQHGVYP